MSPIENYLSRILIVDDESHVLDTYRKCLSPDPVKDIGSDELQGLQEEIFGDKADIHKEGGLFDLSFASQGTDAVKMVQEAKRIGKPFSVIFLDMRMPPGQDGFSTAKQIRIIDKQSNIVIVTAYSDVELPELVDALPPNDKLFYLRKPFYPQEIQQFAAGLAAKWLAEAQLEVLLDERTDKLVRTNINLREVKDDSKEIEQKLSEKQSVLEKKDIEVNTLKQSIELLFHKKFDVRKEFEENMIFNVNQQIMPYLKRLKKSDSQSKREKIITIIENNLQNLISPFMRNLSSEHYNLTLDEMNIAYLICQGMRSKEIGDSLNISKRTVEYHREQLREKLRLKRTSKSLKASLIQMRLDEKPK